MKAQAALEFLMTYGWAILIVIAVVAALYAMGVFKLPTGGLGGCSPCFPSGGDFAYVAHNASHLLVRIGPNKVKINGTTYDTGSTVPVDISTQCNWATLNYCDVSISYSLVVDETTELAKTATARLHKTW